MGLTERAVFLLIEAIGAVTFWFLKCFEAVKAADFYLTMVFVSLSCAYMLAPILGKMRGSDKSSRKGGKRGYYNGRYGNKGGSYNRPPRNKGG